MAIIVGGDSGIVDNSYSQFVSELNKNFNQFVDLLSGELKRGIPPPPLEKVYVDNGFENVPGTSFVDSTVDNVDDIKQRQITSQEPSLTVYVKKRAFAGLSDENDTRFMDRGEKLYLRATKVLFEKKCLQLAAYEGLTKLSKLVSEDAGLDAARIEKIADLLYEYADGTLTGLAEDTNTAISLDPLNTERNSALLDALRQFEYDADKARSLAANLVEISQKQNKLRQATNTNWVIDPDQKDVFGIGRGSGVIELTMIDNLNTSIGIDDDEGRINFSVQDPYNLMKISSDDLEIA